MNDFLKEWNAAGTIAEQCQSLCFDRLGYDASYLIDEDFQKLIDAGSDSVNEHGENITEDLIVIACAKVLVAILCKR